MIALHFFLLLGLFFNFSKRTGETFPPPPTNYAPDVSSGMCMHPKTIVNTSHQSFKELIVSTLNCNKDIITTTSHTSTFKNITKILKKYLKI